MGVILGIESTAHTFSFGGVYTNGKTIPSSSALFRPEQGGIHPREAADHHSLLSGNLFKEFISKNHIPVNQIDAIAFSQGPGLGPCLRVGASVARSLSDKIPTTFLFLSTTGMHPIFFSSSFWLAIFIVSISFRVKHSL